MSFTLWYPLVFILIPSCLAASFISSSYSKQDVKVMRSGAYLKPHEYERRHIISSPSSQPSQLTSTYKDEYSSTSSITRRREFLSSLIAGASSTSMMVLGEASLLPQPCEAVITDETSTFANTDSDSAYSPKNLGDYATTTTTKNNMDTSESKSIPTSIKINTDEVKISIPISKLQSSSQGLGIELTDIDYKSNKRVYVKSIKPQSLASEYSIQPNYIVVSINGQSTERTNSKGVAIMVSQVIQERKDDANATVDFIFRDSSLFQQQLTEISTSPNNEVTTQIAPADVGSNNNSNQDDQQLTVRQLVAPKICRRGATRGDLLEVSYIGKVLDTGAIFDGSAVKINGQAVPGRGNDVSIFFVLGQQNFGQFPPGWDVGLEGICVGERRSLILPPVLAYGNVGVPRRGIPPNATIQYDVTLISINGLATPQ